MRPRYIDSLEETLRNVHATGRLEAIIENKLLLAPELCERLCEFAGTQPSFAISSFSSGSVWPRMEILHGVEMLLWSAKMHSSPTLRRSWNF